MMNKKLSALLCVCITLKAFASCPATSDAPVLPIGYMHEDAPIAYTYQKNPTGIAVDLLQKSLSQSCIINYQFIPYTNHHHALDDLTNNKIAILLGDFIFNNALAKEGIQATQPFFVDKNVLFTSVDELSFSNVFSIMWSKLLSDSLLFSFLTSIVVCVALFFIEGRKHPQLKDSDDFEKCSYTVYQVWCCFLKDLIFDPVTNLGRLVMSAWIIFSLIMMTVITSLVTSNIILLNTDSSTRIPSPAVMYFKSSGYLYGHNNLKQAIEHAHGISKAYNSLHQLVESVFRRNTDIGVASKIQLNSFLELHQDFKEKLIVSDVAIAYENFVALFSPALSKTLLKSQLYQAVHYIVEGQHFYHLCQKHTAYPEHCLVS